MICKCSLQFVTQNMLKCLIYVQKSLKMDKSGHASIRVFALNALAQNSKAFCFTFSNIFPGNFQNQRRPKFRTWLAFGISEFGRQIYFEFLLVRFSFLILWATWPLMVWGLQIRPKIWPPGWTFWTNRYLKIVFSKFSYLLHIGHKSSMS